MRGPFVECLAECFGGFFRFGTAELPKADDSFICLDEE
jgi:hypothetical protein